jgi:hypothetical protein
VAKELSSLGGSGGYDPGRGSEQTGCGGYEYRQGNHAHAGGGGYEHSRQSSEAHIGGTVVVMNLVRAIRKQEEMMIVERRMLMMKMEPCRRTQYRW